MINGAEGRVEIAAEVIRPAELRYKWVIKTIFHPVDRLESQKTPKCLFFPTFFKVVEVCDLTDEHPPDRRAAAVPGPTGDISGF